MTWTDETINTTRLVLRSYDDRDRATVVALFTDPQVREFLGGPIDLPDDFDEYPLGRQPDVWAVEVAATSECIGACSFKRDRGRLELSYTFLPTAWGHGYAEEACEALIERVWATNDDTELIAVTQTANTRSLALLDRLGFTETERFEEFGAEQSLQVLPRPA